MHPDLQILDQQYRVLAENLRNGHVSQEDAQSLIANMTTFDGQGYIWSIDPFSGNFTRGLPGQESVPTDPSLFAPAQLPRTPAASWASDPADLQAYPSQAALFHPEPSIPKTRSKILVLLGTVLGVIVGTFFGGLGGLLRKVFRGRLRTILVPAVLLLVAVYFVTRSPAVKDSPDNTAVSTFPSIPPATIDIPSASTAPPIVVEIALPSRLALDALSVILNDGNRQKVLKILPTDLIAKLGLNALVGAPRAGFSISLGDAVLSNDVPTLAASVLADGVVVEVWSLTLAPLDAGWQILSAVKVS